MLRAKTAERRCGSVLALEVGNPRWSSNGNPSPGFFSKKWMDFPEKGGCVLRDDTVKAKGFTKGSFCGVF